MQTPRQATVGEYYMLRAYWWGQVPAAEEDLMFVVKVLGEERTWKVGRLYGRLIPGGDAAFVIIFSITDYYDASGRLGGDTFRPYIVSRSELDALGYAYEDNPTVPIELAVYDAIPDPTSPLKWKRGKCWVRRTHSVMLSCPHCTY
jgi:hypothetical protein